MTPGDGGVGWDVSLLVAQRGFSIFWFWYSLRTPNPKKLKGGGGQVAYLQGHGPRRAPRRLRRSAAIVGAASNFFLSLYFFPYR